MEISAGEVVVPREPLATEGLATFGKGRDLKAVSPQASSELMTITLNDMGESDDADSADYTSPLISPMNKWVSQHTGMLQQTEDPKHTVEPPSKHFAFDEQKVSEAKEDSMGRKRSRSKL